MRVGKSMFFFNILVQDLSDSDYSIFALPVLAIAFFSQWSANGLVSLLALTSLSFHLASS